jgi:hypothetical protein
MTVEGKFFWRGGHGEQLKIAGVGKVKEDLLF